MSFPITVRRIAALIPVVLGAAVIAVAPVQAQPETGTVAPMIVGGSNATENYSFMGSIQVGGGHYCGASLISPQWLVTAAHCTYGQSGALQPSQMRVRLGSADQASGGTLNQVAQIVRHPSYRNNNIEAGYDIAVLRLSQTSAQAAIAIGPASPAANTAIRLIGWGQTCPQAGCGGAPRMLKQLDTRVLADTSCRGIQAGQRPTELCIYSTTSATACYGDSGGPALLKVNGIWQLYGATSRSGGFSSTCGTAGDNAVYTDVVSYRQWIRTTTGV